jgi:hypothetical protein
MIAELERLSKEHGKPLMCARRKNGSWIIYLAPGAEDVPGLLMNGLHLVQCPKCGSQGRPPDPES